MNREIDKINQIGGGLAARFGDKGREEFLRQIAKDQGVHEAALETVAVLRPKKTESAVSATAKNENPPAAPAVSSQVPAAAPSGSVASARPVRAPAAPKTPTVQPRTGRTVGGIPVEELAGGAPKPTASPPPAKAPESKPKAAPRAPRGFVG